MPDAPRVRASRSPPRPRRAARRSTRGVIVAGGRSGAAAGRRRAGGRDRLAGARRPAQSGAAALDARGRGVRRAAAPPRRSPPTTRRRSSCTSASRPPRRCSRSGSPPPARQVVQVGAPGRHRPRPVTSSGAPRRRQSPMAARRRRTGARPARRGRPAGLPHGARRGAHRASARRPRRADRARRRAGRSPRPLPDGAAARGVVVDAGPRRRVVRRPGRRSPCTPTVAPTASTASISTAIGVALATGGRPALLVGDIAFLHDSRRSDRARGTGGSTCTIVVVDNDGGGIFSFLPQADGARRTSASSSSSARRTAPTSSPSPRPTASPPTTVSRRDALADVLTTAGAVGHSGGAPTAPPTSRSTRRSTCWHRRPSSWRARPGSGAVRPDRRMRASAPDVGLRADERRQHGLELGLGLGQLGPRVAVGHDAAAGEQAGAVRSAGARRSGCRPPTCRCPPRRPSRRRPRVATAVDPLELGDQRERGRVAGRPPSAGVGCSAAHELEHVAAAAPTADPRRGCRGAGRWPRRTIDGSGS